MAYRTYFFVVGFLLLLGTGTALSLTFLVDPYQVFHVERTPGVNVIKLSSDSRRLFKPLDVIRQEEIDVLVLGSSRGVELYKAAKSFWPQKHVANASVSALRMREATEFIQFYSELETLDTIIYQPDFFGANANVPFESGFLPGIVAKGQLWRLRLLALHSFSAIIDSVRTVRLNRGTAPPQGGGKEVTSAQLTYEQLLDAFTVQLTNYQNYDRFYKGFQLDKGAFTDLENALRHAKKNGKSVLIVLGSSHAWQWEAMRASGLAEAFTDWKLTISNLAEKLDIQAYDFAAYSDVSTRPVEFSGDWFRDSSHYTEKTAQVMLACMLQGRDCERLNGARLYPKTVQSRAGSDEAARQSWLADVSQAELDMFHGTQWLNTR